MRKLGNAFTPENTLAFAVLIACQAIVAEARVVRLRMDRRDAVLNGKSFGLAGAYEKLAGKLKFALDRSSSPNSAISPWLLATRIVHWS